MTIQELKEKKRRLEEEIAEKIRKFEEECDVEITDISLSRQYLSLEQYHIIEPVEVKLEVKL